MSPAGRRIVEPPNGRIDLEAAKAQYAATLDPARRLAYEARLKKQEEALAAPEPPVDDAEPAREAARSETAGGETTDLFNFAHARTRKEAAHAKLAEIKVREQSGRLIDREIVAQREFAIARTLRDRILGFPARVANLVPPEAMRTLTDECEALIRELQDAAARIAEDPANN